MTRIVLLFLFGMSFGLQAQVNHHFIDTNSTWRLFEFYYDGLILPPSFSYADANFIAGTYEETDSLRTARLGSVFYGRTLNYIEVVDSGIVFVSDTNGEDTILLYDFTVEVGDSFLYRGLEDYSFYTPCNYLGPQSDSALMVVTELDTIGVAGSERKVVRLDQYVFRDTIEFPGFPYLDYCESITWIEGIGKMTEPHFTNGGFVEYSVYRLLHV